MNNTFELEFGNTITKLAGNDFGCEIYNTQVRDYIDFTQDITIIFPNRIDSIASSFVQGFFDEIVANIGISGIENMVEIISSIPNVKKIVIDNLL